MTDAALRWDADIGAADLVVLGDDLERDDGLLTAVIISLFSDARADAAELPRGEADPRGWWGDGVEGEPEDNTGSKLWLGARAKASAELPARVEAWALEALGWLLEDDVAREVTAVADRSAPDRLDLAVGVRLPDGALREYVFRDVAGAAA